VSQAFHPLLSSTLHPLADGPFADSQGVGYLPLFLQPRSFNSKARKRLPSRQLVASLDSVFSIVGVVIPMSLDLYADICKSMLAVGRRGRETSQTEIVAYAPPASAESG
jgi:hypothetical protein